MFRLQLRLPQAKRRMRKESHKPVRTCLGCMKQDAKAAMVRIVTREEKVVPDPEAKLPGRGGNLHPRTECLDAFVASKAREFRSLGRRIERETRRELVKAVAHRLAEEGRVEYNRYI